MTVLYTGLDPSRYTRRVLHCPLIEIVPLDTPEIDWEVFTHVIVTSRTAAKILRRFDFGKFLTRDPSPTAALSSSPDSSIESGSSFALHSGRLSGPLFPKIKPSEYMLRLPPAYIIAVGQATADALERVDAVAADETQEGIIVLLEKMDLVDANICLPRSKQARREIDKYLSERGISYKVVDLYDVKTKPYQKLPDLSTIEEVVFTSPSTVRAFKELFGALPSDKKLTAIGPVTKQALRGETHE